MFSTSIPSPSYFVTHTGRTIIQISTIGIGNSSLQVGNTKGKTWRQLKNSRGYTLQCTHYLPLPFPQDTSLPCVIYCHGNSGCRADANEAAVILLPSNITVFNLDFSGSGLSDGDYVAPKTFIPVLFGHAKCWSYTSSNRGSWGRCCSLGGSDEEFSAELRAEDSLSQKSVNVYATPMHDKNSNNIPD
ncbi:hypothetical protein Lal_00040743 [Lupinus albus]|nr:hypothetical protein Lal_00040743 [Lupinus albus]